MTDSHSTSRPPAAAVSVGPSMAGSDPLAAGLDPRQWRMSLFEALVQASAGPVGSVMALEDQERKPIDRNRLKLAACVLGRRLATMTEPGAAVGVLMPNVAAAGVLVFALAAYGRVPAMLNFTAGPKNLIAACKAAKVRTVFTSDAFVRQGKLEDTIAALKGEVEVVALEDVRKALTLVDKGFGAAYAAAPGLLGRAWRRKPDDVAVVLFTSGTEGAPKGVALSNANLLANVAQVRAVYAFSPDDTIFNALPIFHSFGLTAGLLLPVVAGFKSFLYPSPLHYKQIPGFVRSSKASILVTTDTFASGWGRSAEADDFASVKLTILGAERVKEQTRQLWRERFGVELNEGYGVTETAPVLAVNIPGKEKDGTVGTLLPGIEARLEPVPGLDDCGRLWVRGPNVMMGYYKPDAPGVLQRLAGDWHDTGDIVSIDAAGYVSIRGRAKRFAKIGGEMISLAAVEAMVASVWPEASHAAVSLPDPRKGEALVLITDHQDATVEPLLAFAKAHGIPELMVPKRIAHVDALPVLGTGKLDFVGIEQIAATSRTA